MPAGIEFARGIIMNEFMTNPNEKVDTSVWI